MVLVRKKGHGFAKLIDESKLLKYLADGFEVMKQPKGPKAPKEPKIPKPDETGGTPNGNGGEAGGENN